MDTLRVSVRSLTLEAHGILSVELVPANGGLLPAFTAGSHIDLHLSKSLSRSYSLTNSQDQCHRYVVAVNKDPASRGGSRHIHELLRPGDSIEISAPRNHFNLIETARHVAFIAGGIGITPLWCMIQRLETLGQSWELHYSTRTRSNCAYYGELSTLEANRPGRVHFNFDHEPGAKLLDLSQLIGAAATDTHLYCCGPVPMLKAFEASASARPHPQVHVEYFAAKNEPAASGGYAVTLARSGRSFAIPAGKSILDTLLDAGVDAPFSCTQGVCGACEVKVLEGIPDHQDSILSDEERSSGKTMMICCSGSKTSSLVLDL